METFMEACKQYIPEIMTVIVGIVSSGGCVTMIHYLLRHFNELKSDNDINELKRLTAQTIKINNQLVEENAELKEQLRKTECALNKVMYDGKE